MRTISLLAIAVVFGLAFVPAIASRPEHVARAGRGSGSNGQPTGPGRALSMGIGQASDHPELHARRSAVLLLKLKIAGEAFWQGLDFTT